MNQNLFFGLLLGLCALTLLNCQRSKQIILPHTLEIFPVTEGQFRISYVRDTTFDTRGRNAGIPDVYFKQERIGGEESDLLGRPIHRVEVYRSDSSRAFDYDFQIDRVFAHYLEPDQSSDYYGERIEENQRILLLKYPAFKGVKWNGNLFNNLGSQEFKYHTIDTTVEVRGTLYEQCVMVIQKADTAGFINDKFAYEIYAPGVGLIKKFDRTLVFDGPMGEFNPDKSRIYIEEIVEHN